MIMYLQHSFNTPDIRQEVVPDIIALEIMVQYEE